MFWVDRMRSRSNTRLKKACGILLPKMKFENHREQTNMGRRYDHYNEWHTSEEFIFEHEECRGLRSGGEQVSSALRVLAVGGIGGSGEPASLKAARYPSRSAAQSAIASWSLHRADDGRAHRSKDGRDGSLSRWGEIVVRRGRDS